MMKNLCILLLILLIFPAVSLAEMDLSDMSSLELIALQEQIEQVLSDQAGYICGQEATIRKIGNCTYRVPKSWGFMESGAAHSYINDDGDSLVIMYGDGLSDLGLEVKEEWVAVYEILANSKVEQNSGDPNSLSDISVFPMLGAYGAVFTYTHENGNPETSGVYVNKSVMITLGIESRNSPDPIPTTLIDIMQSFQ